VLQEVRSENSIPSLPSCAPPYGGTLLTSAYVSAKRGGVGAEGTLTVRIHDASAFKGSCCGTERKLNFIESAWKTKMGEQSDGSKSTKLESAAR
jgi:hypothetical protein